MGPRAPGLVARWAAGGRRGEPRESISSWGVWTLEGTRGPGRLALGVGSACPRGGPPLARGEGLWAPGRRSQVGPGHSPVGGERWTGGRRRGGEAIREEGLGRCATRGGQAPPYAGPRGPLGVPQAPWLAWRMVRFAGRRAREGVESREGSKAQGSGRDSWVPWMYIWMSLGASAPRVRPSRIDRPPWAVVEGGVAHCRAPTRYILYISTW